MFKEWEKEFFEGRPIRKGDVMYFHSIAIQKTSQNHKIGTKLLLEVINYAITRQYKYILIDCVSKAGRALAERSDFCLTNVLKTT